MNSGTSRAKPVVTLFAAIALCTMPVAQAQDGSDAAFDRMVGSMAGRDTGSMWFDYYVEVLNQDIASKDARTPYGAAGPAGPVSGFDGYVDSFLPPDTGSIWFNHYVDDLNRHIQERQLHE